MLAYDAPVKPRLGLCFQYDRSGGVSFRYSDSAIYITLHKPIECLQHFAKGESSSGGFGC